MPRLIDADEAKETLKHLLYETAMNNLDIADIYEDIAEKRLETWLGLVPTVNAYPACMHNKMMQIERAKRKAIVTCDECRWCKVDGGFRRCMMSVIVHPTAEDYCSLGERKEDETANTYSIGKVAIPHEVFEQIYEEGKEDAKIN